MLRTQSDMECPDPASSECSEQLPVSQETLSTVIYSCSSEFGSLGGQTESYLLVSVDSSVLHPPVLAWDTSHSDLIPSRS